MFKKFLIAQEGSIGVTAGAIVLLTVLAAGTAIDVARIVTYRSELQKAADAAVLAAISTSARAYQEFSAKESWADGHRFIDGEEDVKSFFEQNMRADSRAAHAHLSTVVKAEKQTLTSSLTLDAKVPLTFARMVGIKSFSTQLVAKAARNLDSLEPVTRPTNVTFFLDNSPSMGIGATRNDISWLAAQTQNSIPGGCAFACHTSGATGWTPQGIPQFRQQGLRLRIDELKESVRNVIEYTDNFQRNRNTPSDRKVAMAIFSFEQQQDVRRGWDIAELRFEKSTDYAALKTTVANLDVQTVGESRFFRPGWYNSYDYQGRPTGQQFYVDPPGKNFPHYERRNSSPLSTALETAQKHIKGYRDQRKNILFLVTDGAANFNRWEGGKCWEVGNYRSPSTDRQSGKLGDCLGPIDVDLCNRIKKEGTRIAVVYTKYEAFTNEDEFRNIVQPQLNVMEDNLRRCASGPELFAKAGFDGTLAQAILKVYRNAIMNLKLVE
ncbi:pilus assembly protein TadG-related protein [Brucella intermedia]|uniref:pilus assembly protein TadG-related protein n=1 Tax=Brucella intermedia TaxID=94625 RepID=UPI0004698D1B|nr:pilus assembly protein TadG-related protein [Brucella intermedia]